MIPTLIALTSVTGVAAAWRSSELGGEASGRNRELIRQTVVLRQTGARVEGQLAIDVATFAQYRTEVLAAAQLEAQVPGLRSAGLLDRAALATNEARTRRDLADRMLALTDLRGYLAEPDSGVPTFDEARRRADLHRRFEGDQARLDPVATRRQADLLDARSQRLVGWIVAFAAVGFLLTIAQVSRRAGVRRALAVGGAGAYALATLGTFVMGKA